MFINIGSKFIRTGDIKSIDIKSKALDTYSGDVIPVGVELDELVKQINESEKDSSCIAMTAERITQVAP